MNILRTGGAGYIGSNTALSLARRAPSRDELFEPADMVEPIAKSGW